MESIKHRIGIPKTTLQEVYNAIATKKGLSKWWTRTIKGESKLGDVLSFIFSFGESSFKIIRLKPYKEILWECVDGPDEWIGTHIRFDIYKNSDEVVLLFEHYDWESEVEFMFHCSTLWAYFLIGLKNQLSKQGKAQPYGADSFIPLASTTNKKSH